MIHPLWQPHGLSLSISLQEDPFFAIFYLGELIRSLAAHPIRGGAADAQVFRLICNLLLRGEAVLIFPEGTRTKTGEIGTIKPGIFLIVSRTKVPIVPVYIHGSSKAWGRERRLPKLWGKIACVFGSPIHAQDFAHLGKKEAEAAICEKIYSSLLALQHWYCMEQRAAPHESHY